MDRVFKELRTAMCDCLTGDDVVETLDNAVFEVDDAIGELRKAVDKLEWQSDVFDDFAATVYATVAQFNAAIERSDGEDEEAFVNALKDQVEDFLLEHCR